MDYDNFDIFKLIENAIEEQNVTDEEQEKINKTAKEIKDGGFKAAKNKKNKENINQQEDTLTPEDDSIESEEDPDLSPIFKAEEEEADDTSITLDDARDFNKFRDALNRFRAAGSLKDSEVEDNLKKYFKNMNSGERQAIYVTIKGLTQVADLVMSGEDAFRPSNNGIKITASSSGENKKIEISNEENEEKETKKEKRPSKTKRVSKKPSRLFSKKTPEKVKSSTNPIQVESKIQNKSDILCILRENFDKV
jgi:hypothetical protein